MYGTLEMIALHSKRLARKVKFRHYQRWVIRFKFRRGMLHCYGEDEKDEAQYDLSFTGHPDMEITLILKDGILCLESELET